MDELAKCAVQFRRDNFANDQIFEIYRKLREGCRIIAAGFMGRFL